MSSRVFHLPFYLFYPDSGPALEKFGGAHPPNSFYSQVDEHLSINPPLKDIRVSVKKPDSCEGTQIVHTST